MLLDDATFTASELEALRLVDWFLAFWFHFGSLSSSKVPNNINTQWSILSNTNKYKICFALKETYLDRVLIDNLVLLWTNQHTPNHHVEVKDRHMNVPLFVFHCHMWLYILRIHPMNPICHPLIIIINTGCCTFIEFTP